MFRVAAGFVTVETDVGPGRAFVDVPHGHLLPDDVPGEQVQALLAAGAIEKVAEEQAEPEPEPEKPKRRRKSG